MAIQMPAMNGIEATKTIRAMEDPRLANLPIMAMTANAFEEEKHLVISAGMNTHLGKPIDIVKLFSTVQDFLSNTERNR